MPDVKQIVKRTGLLLDRLIAPPDGITILIYHRVGGDSGSEVDLDAAMFDRQLEHLAEHHRVLSLDDAVAELTAAHPTDGPQHRRAPTPHVTAPTTAVAWSSPSTTAPPTSPTSPSRCSTATGCPSPSTRDPLRRRGPIVPWGDGTVRRGRRCATSLATGSSPSARTPTTTCCSTGSTPTRRRRPRPVDRADRRPPRRRARHFAYPKALPGSPRGRDRRPARFRQRVARRQPGQPARPHRPAPALAHPDPARDGFDTFRRKARGGLRLEGELRSGSTAGARYRGADR